MPILLETAAAAASDTDGARSRDAFIDFAVEAEDAAAYIYWEQGCHLVQRGRCSTRFTKLAGSSNLAKSSSVMGAVRPGASADEEASSLPLHGIRQPRAPVVPSPHPFPACGRSSSLVRHESGRTISAHAECGWLWHPSGTPFFQERLQSL